MVYVMVCGTIAAPGTGRSGLFIEVILDGLKYLNKWRNNLPISIDRFSMENEWIF